MPPSGWRNDQIALLLRHLWATDGCIWAGPVSKRKLATRVYFGTSSPGLATDVAALLLRLGIVARVRQDGRREADVERGGLGGG